MTKTNPFSSFTPISFTGTDLTSAKRGVDLWKMVAKNQLPDYSNMLSSGTSTQPTITPTTTDYGASESSVGDLKKQYEAALAFERELQPMYLDRMRESANLQAMLSNEQLRQVYPLLSAAGAETTARNLAASQAYRRFAEGLPSNVQNIMASKQAQATSAASAEAERQRATAAQQQAAKDFAGRFAGQYIQVG
jgi:hypothetical protein